MNDSEGRVYTAALVIIGNEVLSGRTQDANTSYLATRLNELGIRLVEVRIVRDEFDAIAGAVNPLRAACDYVFTTGGIGPTHDDITAEAVARALGMPLEIHPEAFARLERHYPKGEFNANRQRMAHTPRGAVLIDNPVSAAPGFQIENVYVLAGVPRIMQAMFEGLRHRLVGGAPLLSRTIRTNLPEGTMAGRLGELQAAFGDIEIGSYPLMSRRGPGVRLVLRSVDGARLDEAVARLLAMIAELGGEGFDVELSERGD